VGPFSGEEAAKATTPSTCFRVEEAPASAQRGDIAQRGGLLLGEKVTNATGRRPVLGEMDGFDIMEEIEQGVRSGLM
jgi:hypothetical protein